MSTDTTLTFSTMRKCRLVRSPRGIATLAVAIALCYVILTQEYHLAVVRGISKVFSWFSYEPSRIYFVEASAKVNLEAREACSIESAALHHPEQDVIVYSTPDPSIKVKYKRFPGSTYSKSDPYVKILSKITNIHFQTFNSNEVFSDTPLSSWAKRGLLNLSTDPIQHLSDAARLALLWKRGGTYLDTDVIVVRSFHGLKNSVALDAEDHADGAILLFERHFPFLERCMEDYAGSYEGAAKEWGDLGSGLITRNLRAFCNASGSLKEALEDPFMPFRCKWLILEKQEAFYSVAKDDWRVLFREYTGSVDLDLSSARAVHLWGQYSRAETTQPGSNSVLDYLASNNCPKVYEKMKKDDII